jgi:hypothetical protein
VKAEEDAAPLPRRLAVPANVPSSSDLLVRLFAAIARKTTPP